ncbi:MAG: GNAT family N-acetyltransferase [Myxococcaceae bacterium]|nr:GNAT family N-acetyltransferase [Myxococcaceae bacterium]
MTYRVRLVDHTDQDIAEDIADLDKVIFCDGSPNLSPEEIASGGGWWWLAYLGDEPVAYAGMRPGVTPSYAYLCRAGVLQEHRGHRLQPRLVRAREAHARRLGFTHAVSDTAYYNVASANNLIRAGYRLYKPAAPWSWDTQLYWLKPLCPTNSKSSSTA